MIHHPDLLDVLAASAKRRGEHVAVEAPEGNLSYRDVDRYSNRLAHRLRGLGVGPEVRVGISLHRGARELVAMLATMKAGGAYVPLDPSHPTERLHGIIQDASPEVMVVHSGSALSAPVRTVVLDDLEEATTGQPETALDPAATPEQIAYILFTSGSTGRPKGVEITRGGFANFFGSMAREPGLREDDRLLAITTTSFDIAGLELFLPMYVGATTVIADRETVRDPRRLRAKLENSSITLLQATPATWRLLLEAGWRGDGRLRMLCGGEALSPALADRLLTAGGELWNVYGPTETTVWSSLQRIEPGYDRITIGKPIDETQFHILDETLTPLPPGHEGELWIGGTGLARGYRGRPELTAERFIQNPHGVPGDRIYRTGDLGRQLADGRFECLGRLDHQVKIQGFRIELGEIETLLRKVPGVNEALVVAERHDDGDARLIAYWVGPAEREQLIQTAKQYLPAYMVPAAYVSLAAFPLNTNGKIDRKQLPKPGFDTGRAPNTRRPGTPMEQKIAAVWSAALGLPELPLDQSFFTLGGTSALALKVVSNLERELGLDLPLQALYEAPTVEGLAASLGKSYSPDAPIVAQLSAGKSGQLPLFCLLGVTLYQELAFALSKQRTIFAVHVPFRYVPGRDPRPSLDEVAKRYVEIVRSRQSRGPYHLLGLCFGGVVAYAVARQLQTAGEEVESVTIIDAVLPHGKRVDQGQRVRHLLRRAWTDTGELARSLRHKLDGRFGSARPRGPEGLVDLPIDGPEADADVASFAAKPTKLSTRLLVVRAGQEPWPEYVQVAMDQGWSGWADRVIVCSVPADHLGVLREPHVRLLAQAVSEVSSPAPLEGSGSASSATAHAV